MHRLFKRFGFGMAASGGSTGRRHRAGTGGQGRRVARGNRCLFVENLESRQLLTTVVSGVVLMHDTGASPTDRLTREAAVSARVQWTAPETTQVDVEFDHHGDGQAEGRVTTSWSGTAFSYDPLATDATLAAWEGPLTLRYRTVTYQAGGSQSSPWQDFSLFLDRVAPTPVSFGPTSGGVVTSSPEYVMVTFDEPLAVSSVQGTSVGLVQEEQGFVELNQVSLLDTNQVQATIADGSLSYGDYTTYAMSVSDLAGNWYYANTTAQWQYLSAPTASVIAPIGVLEDAESTTISLYDVFNDAETADQDLVLAITQNTNPGLFSSVSINGATGELTLDYAPDAYGTAQLTVQATDEQNLTVATTIVVTVAAVNDPPRIVDFVGIPGPTVWTFSGTVIDEQPVGLQVRFGGLLSGQYAVVEADGKFYLSAALSVSGTVTAQTTDQHDEDSNIAWDDVIVA